MMESFVHLRDYRAVICTHTSCRYAVLPSNIDTHLRAQHRMSVGLRREIIAHIMSIPSLIVNEEHLGLVNSPNPPPRQPAIPHLPVYSDGLGCSYIPCPYVCRSRDGVIKHCESVHGWVNPYKRGRVRGSRPAREYPWRTEVYCQRLFTRGVPQEYFEVAPVPVQTTDTPPSRMADKVKYEFEGIIQTQEAIAGQEAVAQPEQMSDTNPWLEGVEWAHHLAGFPFEEMIQWAELPREEEITLQRICDSFGQVISVAQQLIISQRCTFFARLEINRKEKEKTPQRPF